MTGATINSASYCQFFKQYPSYLLNDIGINANSALFLKVFLIERMGLVGIEENTNIWLWVCDAKKFHRCQDRIVHSFTVIKGF